MVNQVLSAKCKLTCGSGPVNKSGNAAKTNGRLINERTRITLIGKRDNRNSTSISVKNKIYAGQAPDGERFKQTRNASVKIIFTLASVW